MTARVHARRTRRRNMVAQPPATNTASDYGSIGRYYDRCREDAEKALAELSAAKLRGASPRELDRLECKLEQARNTGD